MLLGICKGSCETTVQSPADTDVGSNSSSTCSSSESDDDFKVSISTPTVSRRSTKVNVLEDPDVAGALDRVNLPDRGATYVVAAVSKALGHDVNAIVLSGSSLRRQRCENREKKALA